VFVQLVKKFHIFYGTLSLITVFTRARHWYLSWGRRVQTTPLHAVSLRSILMLSSHLRLHPTSCVFRLGSRLDLRVHFSSPRACYMPFSSSLHLITLIIFGEEYKLWSASFCISLQPAVTCSSCVYRPDTNKDSCYTLPALQMLLVRDLSNNRSL
jgi:hypothetical protein